MAPSTARPCPACAAAEPRPWGAKNAHPLVRCRRCSTLHTAFLVEETYDDYYDARNLAIPGSVAARIAEITAGFADRRRTGRLLDVGFGAGAFLRAAREAGWRVQGVEVSRPAVEHARRDAFDVFHGTLAEAACPSAAFDVVVATEILEHVAAPGPLLAEVARVLRPGGLLWATTPHARGLSARLLGTAWSVVSPPEHLQLFSLAGMGTLLRAAGLRSSAIAAEGLNPRELLEHLRGRRVAPGQRVDSGYRAHAALTSRASGRVLRRLVNRVLSASRLGDTLKISAETPPPSSRRA